MEPGLNPRLYGFHRDKAILETVQLHRCLNAEQIEALMFRGLRSGKRICQGRLKKLTDRGKLKRWRYALEEPYAYYLDLAAKVEQMEHLIALNWVYVWMQVCRKTWDTLYSVEYERDYGLLRCDALTVLKNSATGQHSALYVELDRSPNAFDKVRLYNDLYESEKYTGEWWVPMVKSFPGVIVATTNYKRLKRINEAIERENRHGLEFKVYLVDDLKRRVTAV